MSSVENFKNSVIRIRDILRTPGVSITGMDSMRHICLYLMSRYLRSDRVISMGIPEKFAWENIINTARTRSGGNQFALDYFYHKSEDCLLIHLDKLFGTDNFQFEITSLEKHREILEILDGLDLDAVDCHMDMLGWVYEQHLKTGASAARDLGQFFTDRSVCEYMVRLCDPTIKGFGVPESVCDPTMGTGGFLTAAVRYLGGVDWRSHQSRVHGCEVDPRVTCIARMNMFMESRGVRYDNVKRHDSLYGDLTWTGYDVILANMPFGLKNLNHAECCQRVRDLKIMGKKSEPLFLQLMMASLNDEGRCAVIVPDGMIVNTSILHNGTRKYLLENFELKRVIKMEGDFFMNTGCRTSILFFQKTGNPSNNIEFWSICKDVSTGIISETLVRSIPVERLDKTFSFDVRRYEDQTLSASISKFDKKALKDILHIVGGKANTNRAPDLPVPYYDSNGVIGYVSDPLYTGEYVITARNLSIGAVHYVNGAFYSSDHTINFTTRDPAVLNNRFFYYWLLLNNHVLKRLSSGIKPGIRKSDVAEIKIPVPPVAIQEEIVTHLDGVYKTKALAEAIIDSISKNMKAILHTVRRQHYESMPLKNLCFYKNGKTLSSAQKREGGDYKVMGGGTNYNGTYKDFNRDHYNISVSKSGSAGYVKEHIGRFWAGDCFTRHSNAESVLLNKFLYYYIKLLRPLPQKRSTTIPHCDWDSVCDVMIHVPPIDVQKRLVKRIDEMSGSYETVERIVLDTDSDARLVLQCYF